MMSATRDLWFDNKDKSHRRVWNIAIGWENNTACPLALTSCTRLFDWFQRLLHWKNHFIAFMCFSNCPRPLYTQDRLSIIPSLARCLTGRGCSSCPWTKRRVAVSPTEDRLWALSRSVGYEGGIMHAANETALAHGDVECLNFVFVLVLGFTRT